jgi:hypothetical protein
MAQLSRQWRQANVTPLLKKGSLTDPAIYRPVSITTIPCKVLESILRDHIYNHLERNRLLSGSQHGFVKRKACTTNLLEHEDMVSGFLAQDEVLDIFYADFAKAFDTVSHRKLLFKLKTVGVTGKLHDWVTAFLSNRQQRVVLGDSCSSFAQVTSGVPSGLSTSLHNFHQ